MDMIEAALWGYCRSTLGSLFLMVVVSFGAFCIFMLKMSVTIILAHSSAFIEDSCFDKFYLGRL